MNYFESITTLEELPSSITAMQWSPDGNRFASAHDDGSVVLWNLDRGRPLLSKQRHSDRVTSLSWSCDGLWLASASSDGTLCLTESDTGKLAFQQAVSTTSILCAEFNPDPDMRSTLALGTAENKILLQDLSKPWNPHQLIGHRTPVACLGWSPNGTVLLSATMEGLIGVWPRKHAYDNQIRHHLPKRARDGLAGGIAHRRRIRSLEWSPRGQNAVSASEDTTVRFWKVKEKTDFRVIPCRFPVMSARFCHDGSFLATHCLDGTVDIWAWNGVSSSLASMDVPVVEDTAGICFHPSQNLMASHDALDRSLVIWRVAFQRMLSDRQDGTLQNRKVIVVGAPQVGKSSLVHSLVPTTSKDKNAPDCESTSARKLDSDTFELETGKKELREVWIWDLPNGADYRAIQRLYLEGTSLVVFALETSDLDRISQQVRAWIGESQENQLPIIVAVTKCEQSSKKDPIELNETLRELGVCRVMATDALGGLGINELRKEILRNMEWKSQSTIQSFQQYGNMRRFIYEERCRGTLVANKTEFFKRYMETRNQLLLRGADWTDTTVARSEFDLGLQGLAREGHIYDIDSCILLSIGHVQLWASTLLADACSDNDGPGYLLEQKVYDERLLQLSVDKNDEAWLTWAIIRKLCALGALKQTSTSRGPVLIHPIQVASEIDAPVDNTSVAVSMSFEGPPMDTFLKLSARIAENELYHSPKAWHEAVAFESVFGGVCGLRLRRMGRREGELAVVFDPLASKSTRNSFLATVRANLMDFTGGAPLKEREVSLGSSGQSESTTLDSTKDVFISYNRQDKQLVYDVIDYLSKCGISVWHDERIPVGATWQDEASAIIAQAQISVIFLGPHGFARGQRIEFEMIQEARYNNAQTIIPVLLPGFTELPRGLSQLNRVDMTVPGPRPLEALVHGIRHWLKHPQDPQNAGLD